MNVNFVKYGSELSDQQMDQFLRLEDNLVSKGNARRLTAEEAERGSRKTWYLPHAPWRIPPPEERQDPCCV